jgi:hypothetical protein
VLFAADRGWRRRTRSGCVQPLRRIKALISYAYLHHLSLPHLKGFSIYEIDLEPLVSKYFDILVLVDFNYVVFGFAKPFRDFKIIDMEALLNDVSNLDWSEIFVPRKMDRVRSFLPPV